MKSHFFFKLTLMLIVVSFPIAGYFIWSAFGSTEIGVSLNPSQDLANGLVGWWTFDSKDLRQNAADSSGQGNTGYLTNFTSTTTAAGRLGQALSFDLTDDRVNLSSAPIGAEADATVCAWAKTTTAATTQTVFGEANSSTASLILLRVLTDGTVQVLLRDTVSATNTVNPTNKVGDNKWHHLCFTTNTSGQIPALYIDNVNVGSDTVGVLGTLTTNRADIGAWNNAGTLTHFWGDSIDNIQVWNRQLSSDEINRLYHLGATTKVNVPLASNPNLSSGLVGHWTFDGNSVGRGSIAGSWLDMSGQGNTGYLTAGLSSTTTMPGKIGQALSFNGTDQSVTSSSTPVTAAPLSLCAWFKRTGAFTAAAQGIVAVSDGNVTANDAFRLASGSSGVAAGTVVGGSGAFATAASATTIDGKWYHACAVFTSATQRDMYVDGILRATETTSKTPSGIVQIDIGSVGIPGTFNVSTHFPGLIDDVRIYNRALSADEINRLYHLGATTKVNVPLASNPDLNSGLVGWWTFDGKNLQQNAADSSEQGNTGYLTNFTSTTTVAGKIGQGLNFNGISGAVQVTQSSSINNLSAMTVSAWVYPRSLGEGSLAKIVAKDNNSGAGAWQLFIVVTPSGCTSGSNVYGWGKNNTAGTVFAQTCTANNSITLNKWQHVTLTWAGGGGGTNAQMYMNGIYSPPVSSVGAGSGTVGTDSTLNLFIGNNVADTRTWDGYIDDVRVYNRALSANEVKRLYDLGRQ